MKAWVRPIGTALVALVAAVGLGLVGAVVGLHAPPTRLKEIVGALAVSGGLALAFGLVVILLGMRLLPRMEVKITAGYMVGSLVAIVTILYTPFRLFMAANDLHLLILVLAFFFVISLGLALIASATVSHPLNVLTAAVDGVAAGELGRHVDVPSRDELAHLGHAFNQMSDKLAQAATREQAMKQARRGLIAAISHDLRTPLTSIRVTVETIRVGLVQGTEEITGELVRVQDEIDQLGLLIDELFELSQLESGSPELDVQCVDLRELIADAVEGMRPVARQNGVALALQPPPEPQDIQGDPVELRRAMTNLVQNAIQHTPSGGSVCVRVSKAEGDAIIEVSDTGKGIAAEHLPHIFEMFYRCPMGNANEPEGRGLGLAIAKAVVEVHGGNIQVESQPEGGARFTVTLPITR